MGHVAAAVGFEIQQQWAVGVPLQPLRCHNDHNPLIGMVHAVDRNLFVINLIPSDRLNLLRSRNWLIFVQPPGGARQGRGKYLPARVGVPAAPPASRVNLCLTSGTCRINEQQQQLLVGAGVCFLAVSCCWRRKKFLSLKNWSGAGLNHFQ